jgi:hypothetical protein
VSAEANEIRADVEAIRDALDAFKCTCPEDDDDGKHVAACPYCRPACALSRLADDVMPRQYNEIRDRFAAAALTGLLAADTSLNSEEIGRSAYQLADAMLTARGAK